MISEKSENIIFLCHATEDGEVVEEIYKRLKGDGFNPWLYTKNILPGQAWDKETRKALQSSSLILIFFSSTSIAKRGYVQREFKLALDILVEIPENHIFIIPIRLDNCQIPERFQHIQYVDLFAKDGYDKLIKAIKVSTKQIPPNLEKIDGSLKLVEKLPKPFKSIRLNWWKYIAAAAVIIGILVGVAEFTGYSLKDIFSPQSTPSNTVTVLVHEEKGKDHLILPNRGIVKLIYGDAIISEQINNEGEATFKQVPEHFFQADSKVEILFHDPEGEPYRAIHHDSLYQLTKGKYIALPVKLYGLDQIRGIVKDFETGDPIAGARISVQGEETFSNQYGEYSLPIPLEKQRKLQSIRAFKENYHSFELDSVAVQTGREVPILMKPRR